MLQNKLTPQLADALKNETPTSYSHVIDIAIQIVQSWEHTLQAEFIAGHPRIGESKNLSSLSAKEQGSTNTARATPPEVLARLAHLNACYERRYPGLRYITFVNGRSRAEIAVEIEDVLGIAHSLDEGTPAVESFEPIAVESAEWVAELKRAVVDVGRIAKSRLATLEAR